MSRFSPLRVWDSGPESAHGRIEQRIIEVLPVVAIGKETKEQWPSIRQICRLRRLRQVKKKGVWQKQTCQEVFLITSLSSTTTPQEILALNRKHWGIEIMHRNKDVTLGEDGYTNRSDNAPANVFSLIGLTLKLLKSISTSPTRAIEIMQDDRKRAIAMF